MRAVLIGGTKGRSSNHSQDPYPQYGEVIVRMKAAAICGTDLHDYRVSG